MKNFYTPHSPSAEAAYAEVLDHAMMRSIHRSVADLTGTFAKKAVSGRQYWYFQYRDVDQKLHQVYLGPQSERLDRLIEMKGAAPAQGVSISRHARAAIALGNIPVLKSHFRVIRRLEEYGYFKAGGILIGTHAFLSYGNMLGVDWCDGNQTQDMDFAHAGRSVSLALPTDVKLDVHDAVTSLEMGFLPASKLDGLIGGSYINPAQPDFRLDFLTTEGRDKSELVNFPALNVAMVPLKFMEFSLKDIRQVAILADEGAVLVNVPNPARYALHKLIVAGLRDGSYKTKANKDVRQAASLIAYLSKHLPDDLMEAWEDLRGRGPSWRAKFEKGVALMLIEEPEIEGALLWRKPNSTGTD